MYASTTEDSESGLLGAAENGVLFLTDGDVRLRAPACHGSVGSTPSGNRRSQKSVCIASQSWGRRVDRRRPSSSTLIAGA
jgi:hypothetical protein